MFVLKKLLPALILVSISPISTYAKTAIYSDSAPAPIGIYSQAVEHDGMVYISGQIPIDPKTGNLVKGDFRTELEQTIKNLLAITKAAQGELDDIVKLNIYVTDMENYSVINDVISQYFHKPYPARAIIGVKELPKSAMLEIEAIMAVKIK